MNPDVRAIIVTNYEELVNEDMLARFSYGGVEEAKEEVEAFADAYLFYDDSLEGATAQELRKRKNTDVVLQGEMKTLYERMEVIGRGDDPEVAARVEVFDKIYAMLRAHKRREIHELIMQAQHDQLFNDNYYYYSVKEFLNKYSAIVGAIAALFRVNKIKAIEKKAALDIA